MKKYVKNMTNYVKGAVTLGAGNAVLGGMGSYGNTAASALAKGSSMYGVVGTAMGASAVMGMMKPRRRRR